MLSTIRGRAHVISPAALALYLNRGDMIFIMANAPRLIHRQEHAAADAEMTPPAYHVSPSKDDDDVNEIKDDKMQAQSARLGRRLDTSIPSST